MTDAERRDNAYQEWERAQHVAAALRGELDLIESRANAATPGPWFWHLGELEAPRNEFVIWIDRHAQTHVGCEDMAFIAHAREDVPTLIAEVHRLRDQVAWLEKERERLKDELGEDDHSLRFDVEGIDY